MSIDKALTNMAGNSRQNTQFSSKSKTGSTVYTSNCRKSIVNSSSFYNKMNNFAESKLTLSNDNIDDTMTCSKSQNRSSTFRHHQSA